MTNNRIFKQYSSNQALITRFRLGAHGFRLSHYVSVTLLSTINLTLLGFHWLRWDCIPSTAHSVWSGAGDWQLYDEGLSGHGFRRSSGRMCASSNAPPCATKLSRSLLVLGSSCAASIFYLIELTFFRANVADVRPEFSVHSQYLWPFPPSIIFLYTKWPCCWPHRWSPKDFWPLDCRPGIHSNPCGCGCGFSHYLVWAPNSVSDPIREFRKAMAGRSRCWWRRWLRWLECLRAAVFASFGHSVMARSRCSMACRWTSSSAAYSSSTSEFS